MSTTEPHHAFVYLASQSPRRRELLDQLHIEHRLLIADDGEDLEALETRRGAETPRAYVRRVTRAKADAALARRRRQGLTPGPILVGDTTVAIEQEILGKPADDADARRILQCLSGRVHRVLTAVAVATDDRLEEALSESRVRFRLLTPDDIDAYLATGEPVGRAGAYAIQGRAAAFVERISGSHSGIVGLPLYETVDVLRRFGVVPR